MTRSSDRLSDIWTRFTRGTQAQSSLSGTSVEGTVRPSRQDSPRYLSPEQQLSRSLGQPHEAGTPDPVQVAAQALQASMSASRKQGRRAPAAAPVAPTDLIAEQILRDMKATEARTRRRETDYLAYAAERQASFRGKRKKFLGLF